MTARRATCYNGKPIAQEGRVDMSQIELLLVAIGLSMDAFAVAVCRGLEMRRVNYRQALLIAAFFGGFQALMPIIGYLLGAGFEHYISAFDHWIAFVLLAFIGGKMIWEAVQGGGEGQAQGLGLKTLLMMAVATSIDALAVGITFAFLQMDILPSAGIIGITTFTLSFGGVCVGNRFGASYKKKAEAIGGVVLVLIGLKILLGHLGVLAF